MAVSQKLYAFSNLRSAHYRLFSIHSLTLETFTLECYIGTSAGANTKTFSREKIIVLKACCEKSFTIISFAN
jgi:hypothetical protein